MTLLSGRDVGSRIGSVGAKRSGLVFWDLDGVADRSFVEMVDHFESCSACENAGAELAPDKGLLCPTGSRRRAAWEVAEARCAPARGRARG